MERPDFEAFRSIFLECLAQVAGSAPKDCLQTRWDEVGGLEERRQILEFVNAKLQDDCGVYFEVNHRLLQVDGPVESAIIQAYHELNTIYLLEKINKKIRQRQN